MYRCRCSIVLTLNQSLCMFNISSLFTGVYYYTKSTYVYVIWLLLQLFSIYKLICVWCLFGKRNVLCGIWVKSKFQRDSIMSLFLAHIQNQLIDLLGLTVLRKTNKTFESCGDFKCAKHKTHATSPAFVLFCYHLFVWNKRCRNI